MDQNLSLYVHDNCSWDVQYAIFSHPSELNTWKWIEHSKCKNHSYKNLFTFEMKLFSLLSLSIIIWWQDDDKKGKQKLSTRKIGQVIIKKKRGIKSIHLISTNWHDNVYDHRSLIACSCLITYHHLDTDDNLMETGRKYK